MKEAIIRIVDLSVELKPNGTPIRAVNSINLDVLENEMLSVVGETGSGKTTLCRTIIGLQKPSSGRIEVFGKKIEYDSSSLLQLWKRVQMVFQDPYSTFDPLSTVLDSIEVPLKKFRKDLTKAERWKLKDATLSLVGLNITELRGKYPRELSGGQRQRASIARAIIIEPKILIADEPVSMLDASLRAGVLGVIKNISRKQGMTVISVTHDLAVAERMGDRIAVMKNGQIVELASTDDIINSPQQEYTRRLVGTAPRIGNKEWLTFAEDKNHQ